MPAIDLSFRIGGEAGQGVESSGAGFSRALTRAGLHVFAVPDYYSRIRGGHNFFTIRVSDAPLTAAKDNIELLLALNAETIERHIDAITPGGAVIVDEGVKFDDAIVAGREVKLFQAPISRIAEENGSAVMANTAALAVAAGVVGFDLQYILDVISQNFKKKGGAIVEANRKVAEAAYADATARFAADFAWKLAPQPKASRLAIDGNSAFAMGALMAGCKFVAGYPMTPASSVLEYMAGHADKWGLVVKHAEDEISAINMCVGAAHAGVRAMTTTSGGGFDLMTEGLSLAGMTETPVVVYLAQRPGPATGLATRTSQSDLFLALYGGHGDWPRVLIAPHTPEEAFLSASRALNTAEKYQCVVIVLSDQYNATSVWSRDEALFALDAAIDRGKLLAGADVPEGYQRYTYTDDGVSPRALPGSSPNAVYLATGNEHLEDGHITEDPDTATRMLDKRMRKLEGIGSEMRLPLCYGPKDADLTLIGWGSTYGAIVEAVDTLNARGTSANAVHFVDIWPFPVEAAQEALAGAKRLIDVENNGTAQFAELLRAQTGIAVERTILKYDGRGFTPAFILSRLEG